MYKSSLYYLLLFFLTIQSTVFAQLWGTNTKSQFTNEAVDVELNANNESYVIGYITGETLFNPTTLVPSAAGNGDIYVAKYSSNGILIWKKIFGGNYSDRGVDLAIGPDQNIVITGQYFGTVNFDSYALTSNTNSKDIFLAKLDPQGNVLWARSEGGNQSENAYGVTVDYNNNVILTGQFQGSATIGSSTFVSEIDPNTNVHSFDFFISKYNATGNPLWSLQGKAPYEDRGLAVAVDNQNSIFFTGQFSKTLVFANNTYNNLGYNIGFLCKLTENGNLVFFNQMKAGMTLPYDLEVDKNNQVIVIGDFLGSINYYDANGIHSIQNTYDKKIFALKTTNQGNYQWGYSLGSNNEVSARSVSIDMSNNIYVTGFFKCDLSQIQDSSTTKFNSVGFKDGYLLKVLSNGHHGYIKQFGGKMDDEGHGVAIRIDEQPRICGSYTKDLNFSYPNQTYTILPNSFSLQQGYGAEIPHLYLLGDSTRNSFLIHLLNQTTDDINYFYPTIADSVHGFITNGPMVDLDTIHICMSDWLRYETQTYNHYGPSYQFLWNGAINIPQLWIDSTGDYWVIVQRDDQCASDIDSIYAIKEPIPVLPLLTDNLGINVYQPSPDYYGYHFCYPDSVEVFFSNLSPTDSFAFLHNGSFYSSSLGTHLLTQPGAYEAVVSNAYCSKIGVFTLLFDYIQQKDTIAPQIIMNHANPTGDSTSVCLNELVEFSGINLFVNPNQTFLPDIQSPFVSVEWKINGVQNQNEEHVKTNFSPTASGWYTVELTIVIGYENLCALDTTTYHITRNFYVEVKPIPTWNGVINGSNYLCENGSIMLVVSNPQPSFSWSGPGFIWNNLNDSVEVNQSGIYYYQGTLTDSVNGCSQFFQIYHHIITKQAPVITSIPADGIICPNDSVFMQVPSIYVSYQWIGPDGIELSTSNSCYGDQMGFYYCHVEDDEGCFLTSPPYELREYTTPSITVVPDEFLCENESVTLLVTYSGSPSLVWSPINSTQDEITVNQPGVYSVSITQCGITVSDSVEIIDGTFTASITGETNLCYQDTLLITGSNPNLNYEWSNGVIGGHQLPVTEAGTYSATVTNEFGCVAQTNNITILSIPESAPPSIESTTVCYGESVTLSSTSPFTLNWYKTGDTTLIQSGATFTISPVTQDTSFLVSYASTVCEPTYSLVSITLHDSLGSYELVGDWNLCLNQNGEFSINATNENISWIHGGNIVGTTPNIVIPYNQLISSPVISVELSNSCYSTILTDTVQLLAVTSIELLSDTIQLCYLDQELAEISTSGIDSITWIVNNNPILSDELLLSGSQQYNPIIVYGFDADGCKTLEDTLFVITPTLYYSFDVEFDNYCLGDSGVLVFNSNADSIRWTTPWGVIANDTLAFTIDSEHVGTYLVEFWDNLNCHYTDSIVVPLYLQPDISILPDSIFCLNDIYTFYFPNDTNTYFWENYGNTTSIPILFDQNLILIATSPQGCVSLDTLVVHAVDCSDELPNIITPNGDGINDFFIIDDAYSQLGNTLIIFNRWGNRIFEASPYLNNWAGQGVTDGVYFYQYYPYGIKDDPNQVKQGFIHVYGND